MGLSNLHRLPARAARSGPTIDRSNSSGDIWTPQVFIEAVERKFGKLTVDLAASAANTKAPIYIDETVDALEQGWNPISWRGLASIPDGPLYRAAGPLCWLNPPFSNITPWTRKCAAEWKLGVEILLLTPASVGANWYWDFVEPYAQVYSVGRMVFDNCFNKDGERVTTAYPKDLLLSHYNPGKHGNRMYRWNWKQQQ